MCVIHVWMAFSSTLQRGTFNCSCNKSCLITEASLGASGSSCSAQGKYKNQPSSWSRRQFPQTTEHGSVPVDWPSCVRYIDWFLENLLTGSWRRFWRPGWSCRLSAKATASTCPHTDPELLCPWSTGRPQPEVWTGPVTTSVTGTAAASRPVGLMLRRDTTQWTRHRTMTFTPTLRCGAGGDASDRLCTNCPPSRRWLLLSACLSAPFRWG